LPRPIDHVVNAVRDLDAARAAYVRLGFALTPVARHPFGTANSLIQFDGSFIELVAVVDPGSVPEPEKATFSFAAFNRDFLSTRQEGPSMLALTSRDPAADRADFDACGMPVYAPFAFARKALSPRGEALDVGFEVTFTSDARMPETGFFTCRHERPENFWWPEYQAHPNGGRSIEAVVIVARDPADYHIFFTCFTAQHDIRSDSLMTAFDTGGGIVEIVTPVAARAFYGVDIEDAPRPRLVAVRIAVADLAATASCLSGNAVPFGERLGRLVVPPAAACGAAIAFAAG
jgi:catechol 2,3-dioxygenase-like lactoylglutathione lyase family enzyme